MKFDRADFIADFSSAMDEIKSSCNFLTESDSDSKVFSFLIADMFEDFNEDSFSYTDGSNDRGLDFVIHNGNDFRFYQCKSIDEKNLEIGKTFDATPVNELDEAIEFLLSDEKLNASSKVKNFRNLFQLNLENNHLTAVLAIEGKLSKDAQERFDQVSKKYLKSNINVRLIDEESMYSYWHDSDNKSSIDDIKIDLELQNTSSYMKQNGWVYGIFKIGALIDAAEKYGTSLYDLNVRSKLKKSKINNEIQKTITTIKGQKQFVHLNNGLVIQCNNYITPNENHHTLTLKGAQIINGCQTLSTIWEFYFKNADKETRKNIRENILIFAKIYEKNIAEKDNLLDSIVIASNNQNAMNSRNLKSNSVEQKQIQKNFYCDALPQHLKYFYIRKDGEFSAYYSDNSRQPKKKVFHIVDSPRKGENAYRKIDNEKLAKIWWSWIGNAPKVNNGGIDYFDNNIYTYLFEMKPTDTFYESFKDPTYSFRPEDLRSGTPSQYQFLVAMAFSSFIESAIRPTNGLTTLKTETINDLKKNNFINDKSTKEEISIAITKYAKGYLFAIWKNQMSRSLTEVIAFLLIKKYGPLTSNLCQKLLQLDDISFWLEKGMDSAFLENTHLTEGNSRILYQMNELLDISTRYFLKENFGTIISSNRPKIMLNSRDSIIELKRTCLSCEEDWKDEPNPYKTRGKTFLDCFPSI